MIEVLDGFYEILIFNVLLHFAAVIFHPMNFFRKSRSACDVEHNSFFSGDQSHSLEKKFSFVLRLGLSVSSCHVPCFVIIMKKLDYTEWYINICMYYTIGSLS